MSKLPFLIALGALALSGPALLLACSSDTNADGSSSGATSKTSCTTWKDCVGSAEAEAISPCKDPGGTGTTLHADVACENGACRAECAKGCIPYMCNTAGAICDAPPGIAPSSVTHSCTKNPIVCSTASDCPLQIPDSAGDAGAWSCESGFCRFPGFTYGYE